ncbi:MULTISPECIES: HNH endonuclease signature motif containing protein [unclassified Isoptericola]|uniref:HNH endonuclease signature motif containing protein n=1 Tax=unclassified Isoptericola TaxID=2623355 RepID=UPI0036627F8F
MIDVLDRADATLPAPRSGADDVTSALVLVAAGVDRLAAAVLEGGLGELDGRSAADVSRTLRALGQRLDAARLRVLPVVEGEGWWAVDGARSFAHWLALAEGVSPATAHRDVRTTRTLRDVLPATASAALAGEIGADHVRAMVDVAPTSEARRAALAAAVVQPSPEADAPEEPGPVPGVPAGPTGEELLVSLADRRSAGQFRRLVKRFAHVADPESDERGYARAREKEFLEVSPTWDGYHVAGFLTLEHGQAVRAALDAVVGRPAADDPRTPTQRRGQGLADLARIALDNAAVGSGASVRPHLQVSVSFTELQALAREVRGADGADGLVVTRAGEGGATAGTPAGIDPRRLAGPEQDSLPTFPDHDAPLPPSLLRRLACDSEVTRVVFGADSTVLDVGRSRRTVTGQLRRAVIARDRHCSWPGCDEPPQRCEVHHAVTHWVDGGRTSVENAALLCWHHHDVVDSRGITMRWDAEPAPGGRAGTPEAGWVFRDRHGRPIVACPRGAT